MHRVDVAYTSKCLCIALPNHNLVSLLDKFDSILKFKSDLGLVIGLNKLLVEYFDSLNCLPDAAYMQHGLVARLDVRVVVQNFDLGVEVFDAEGLIGIQAFSFGRYGVY